MTQGKTDGTFSASDSLTRAQAAIMLQRALDLPFIDFKEGKLDKTKVITDFSDENSIGKSASDAVEMVYQAGIFNGNSNGSFAPSAATKRDQMAKILGEFLVVTELVNEDLFGEE